MAEEISKAYYAVIPANIRYDNDVPPNAKLLYGEITALCNQKGYCWATNDYFAQLYGCSKNSVSRWISILKDKGYVSVEIIYKEGSKEIKDRYIQICGYPIPKNEDTPIPKNGEENNTYSFNNTVNKESKKDSFDTIIREYAKKFELPVYEATVDLLREWLKVRKAKRAAMTDRAIQMNIEKLDKVAQQSGMSVVDYLKEVICRGWAAFYVINNYKQDKPKRKEIVPQWCESNWDDGYEQEMMKRRVKFKKTAADDESIRAKAEALRKELNG